MSMRCEILSVGTELLLGNIANTDAQEISQALAELGINVYWHTVVGDNPARLKECAAIARERADLIITTGGLGPTYDDLTKNVLAEAFGKKLVFHEEEAEKIRSHYMNHTWNTSLAHSNLNQAWLPEGCRVLPNTCGTAPGCAFQEGGVTVIMLPGPPNECRAMFRLAAMPYLRQFSDVVLKSHNIRIFGMGESSVEDLLHNRMASMENPTLAPYVKTGEVMLRLTARAKDEAACETLMVPVLKDVMEALGDLVYGVDVDSLEQLVVRLLRERGETVTGAESCTGGLFAKRITDVPGASAVFPGSFVTYCDKEKARLLGVDPELLSRFGAVSAPVACQMARGARKSFGTDYAVGITGSAGPDPDERGTPVGTVYVAAASQEGTWVRQLHLGTDRERTRIVSSSHALDLLRRLIQGLDPAAARSEAL